MLNVPVVVVPAFLHKCTHCGNVDERFLSKHVCGSCGVPQPVSQTEDYFLTLGVGRQFGQDARVLEDQFYQISRVLHPDRFTSAGSDARVLSLQRMSYINQAYTTLKNPALLRDYLLRLEGIQEVKAPLPGDLAEGWFELQDRLSDFPSLEELPENLKQKLAEFEEHLLEKEKGLEQTLRALEQEYDARPVRQVLEKLAQEVQLMAYLQSLSRAVRDMRKGRPVR